MKVFDAYGLARTKLKTRRIRSAIVVFTSALLFAVLYFAAFTIAGAEVAIEKFGEVGFNGRYLTRADSQLQVNNESIDEAYVQAEQATRADLDGRKIKITDEVINGEEFNVEISRRADESIRESERKIEQAFEDEVVQRYKPKEVFHYRQYYGFTESAVKIDAAEDDPYLKQQTEEVVEGKLADIGLGIDGESEAKKPFFASAEKSMFQGHVVSGQTLDWKPGEPYPVIVSYQYLAQLAERSFVKVSTSEKVEAYRELIKDYAGKELLFCHRNDVAKSQLRTVLEHNKMATEDKDPKTVAVATPNCQNFDQNELLKLKIIEDPVKQEAANKKRLFPIVASEPPSVQVLRFRIVGFTPTVTSEPSDNNFEAIFGLVNASLRTNPIIIPIEVASQDPLLLANLDKSAPPILLAEMSSLEQQKQVLASGCQGKECNKEGAIILSSFGNIQVAFDSVISNIRKFVLWAALAIIVMAAFLIMVTISKVIADSRREIAVFRAIGARRIDIAQIYATYGFMLTVRTLVIALVLAISASLILSDIYSASFTDALIQAVGGYELDARAVLLGFEPLWMAAITIALVISAVLGVGLPVVGSVRRSLIKQMREE